MGRVFVAADVRLKKVPAREDFQAVAVAFLDWLKRKPWVVDAVICGSYAADLHGPRSDLDVFILHESKTFDPNEVRERSRQVNEFLKGFARHHVAVSLIWCSAPLAVQAKHTIGEGFASHLRTCSSRSLSKRGGNPTQEFAFNGRHRPRAVALSYLTYKHQGMEDALARLGALRRDETAKLLTDATKAPFHGVRNVLQCLGEPCDMLVDYDEIIKRTMAHTSIFTDEIITGLMKLKDTNIAYNTRLAEQLQRYDPEQYQRCIDELSEAAVLSATLLHQLLVVTP